MQNFPFIYCIAERISTAWRNYCEGEEPVTRVQNLLQEVSNFCLVVQALSPDLSPLWHLIRWVPGILYLNFVFLPGNIMFLM